MSIACDKCEEQGSDENPVYYVESVLNGIPILESLRDLSKIPQTQKTFANPFTLHLHGGCAVQLQELLSKHIAAFIEPKEKPSGKKKKQTKVKDS